jgi:hypothetical protein
MRGKFVKIWAAAVGLSIGLSIGAAPSFSHHGNAAYETNKQATVMGTVVGFDFANPHALVYLDVKQPDGTIRKWQGELTSPNHLVRAGWTKRSLKPGDQVTISGLMSKDGSNSMWIRKIVTSSGEELPLGFGVE